MNLPAALTELEAMFEGQLDAGIVREVLLGLGGNTEAACDAILQMTRQSPVADFSEAGTAQDLTWLAAVCLCQLLSLHQTISADSCTAHATLKA